MKDDNLSEYSGEQLLADQELLNNLEKLVDDKLDASIRNILINLHPADIAEILNNIKYERILYIFKLFDDITAGEVLLELEENIREKILRDSKPEEISNIVEQLDTDDATDIVGELSDEIAEKVLQKLDKEDSDEVKELLKYQEDTAGGLMSSDFVYVDEEATVKEAIKAVRAYADEFDHIYHLYVLSKEGVLLGMVHLKYLLITPLKEKVKSVMEDDLIYVNAELDQEEVATIMEKYDLVAIPVVDSNKKMLGRITIDDIVDVIHEEASEDISKFAGLSEEQERTDSVFTITRIRLPWLLVALVLELLGAILLQNYEAFLKEMVIATFFIPVVMAMGGSSGTQAAIVMVRGLSNDGMWSTNLFKKLLKEFAVAILNGIICALALFIGTSVLFPQVPLKFVLSLSVALLLVIISATMLGSGIPLFLKKLGSDPAIATGPFVTTTNDIIGIVIYLSVISMFFYN